MLIKYIHSLIFFLLFCLKISATEIPYDYTGLRFSGTSGVHTEKRTLVQLTDSKKLNLPNRFSLSFDISFWNVRDFGYIFSLSEDNDNEIHLSNVNYLSEDTTFLMLSVDMKPTNIKIPLSKNEMTSNHWMNLRFFFDSDVGRIIAYLNEKEIAVSPFKRKIASPVDLIFGYILIHKDVPGMIVRNIQIKNEMFSSKHIIHHWELNESRGQQVLDKMTGEYGHQVNGTWIAGEHLYWTPIDTIQFQFTKGDVTGTIEGVTGRDFYGYFRNDTMYKYIFGEKKIKKIIFKNSPPFKKPAIVFDPKHKTYFSFHGGGGSSVSILDTTDWSWSPVQNPGTNDHYYGSVRFTDREGDLYMVGGYGNYHLKNTLQKYNPLSESWDTLNVSGDPFPFRSGGNVARGFGDNDIYLFTPTGNETGDQKDGIKNYGEIWHFDINKMTLSLAYDMSDQRDKYNFNYHILLSDTVNKLIYFMCQTKEPPINQFYKFTSDFTQPIPVGAPLNGNILGSCAIDLESRNIYAFMKDDGKEDSPKTVYKIRTPLMSSGFAQLDKVKTEFNFKKYSFLFILLIGIIFLSIYSFISRKKPNPTFLSPKWKLLLNQIPENHFNIRVFGPFEAQDENGNNITSTFTPKLRDVFINILFSTRFINGNHDGISKQEICNNVWKGQRVSHNTFSVAVARLRDILRSIPSIKIIKNDQFYSVECDDVAMCDFVLYRHLCQYFNSETDYRIELVKEFCKLLSCGEFLPGISNNWLDPVKSELSKEVMSILLKLAGQYDIGNDYELQLILGETILKWDKLEQKGLNLSLSSLKKLGRYGRLNETYSSFSETYKNTFDSEFPHTIKSLTQP